MSRKMTVKQAAKEFFQGTVSEAMIYQECREGKLPHVRLGTNKIILDEASLQQWWENRLAQSVQPKRPEGYGRLRKIAE